MVAAPPGSDGIRVVAVVAARNEEGTIAATVKSLRAIDAVTEVAVIADGSADRTAEEANAAGARVLVTARGLGKGAAVESLLQRLPRFDAYLLVDGDVGGSAAEAEPLLREVLSDHFDVAIGVLPALEGGGFGLVKWFAGRCIRRLTGFEAREPLSGQRCLTRAAMEACRPLADRFGLETAMTIDLVRLGFRVGEVPVDMSHRPTGRGLAGFLHRGGQGLDIARAVLPRALRIR